MQQISPGPQVEKLTTKDVVTPEMISDVEAARVEVQKSGKSVLIKNQDALMITPYHMIQITGTGSEGAALSAKNLGGFIQALNDGKVDANHPAVSSFIENGFFLKKGDQYFLSQGAQKKGILIVSAEESSAEIAGSLLHERRHQKFYTDQSYKETVLNKVDSLSAEQKTLGYIILRIPGSYDGIKTTRQGGEGFEQFATEIDAHASMIKDGFDVSSLITQKKSDFKSSVKEVFEGLKKHARDDKNLSGKDIKKNLSLKLMGDKALIRVEDQLFVIQADSKGQLNPEAGTIEVKEIPGK